MKVTVMMNMVAFTKTRAANTEMVHANNVSINAAVRNLYVLLKQYLDNLDMSSTCRTADTAV